MPDKILVIGATGRTGSVLVKQLTSIGMCVRAATRNPLKAKDKLPSTVELIEFDYDKPETFQPAVKAVNKIFLTARPGDNHSDKAAIPLIDEAKKAGVEYIVDLTAMGVEKDDNFMLRKLEKYIEDSGIAFTHLRPNWFMQNFDSGPLYNDIMKSGALHLPAADASLSFIDVRDISEAAFKILKEDGHEGKAYTLTGKESLTYFQAVEHISRASGRNISYIPISEETACAALTKAGIPQELINRWADFQRIVRAGLCSPVINDLELILGRSPILFGQYVNDYSAAWKL